jgi:hypothetical protein
VKSRSAAAARASATSRGPVNGAVDVAPRSHESDGPPYVLTGLCCVSVGVPRRASGRASRRQRQSPGRRTPTRSPTPHALRSARCPGQLRSALPWAAPAPRQRAGCGALRRRPHRRETRGHKRSAAQRTGAEPPHAPYAARTIRRVRPARRGRKRTLAADCVRATGRCGAVRGAAPLRRGRGRPAPSWRRGCAAGGPRAARMPQSGTARHGTVQRGTTRSATAAPRASVLRCTRRNLSGPSRRTGRALSARTLLHLRYSAYPIGLAHTVRSALYLHRNDRLVRLAVLAAVRPCHARQRHRTDAMHDARRTTHEGSSSVSPRWRAPPTQRRRGTGGRWAPGHGYVTPTERRGADGGEDRRPSHRRLGAAPTPAATWQHSAGCSRLLTRCAAIHAYSSAQKQCQAAPIGARACAHEQPWAVLYWPRAGDL